VPREKKVYAFGELEVTDSLSEISQKITAIPLETNLKCQLSDLKQVKQANFDIFIWSGNDIYRFNRQGRFINRITGNNHNRICKFAIHPDNQHVIVLDSLNLAHYYSFDGNMLFTEDAEAGLPGQTILDIVYHNNYLWAVTENIAVDRYVEKWLYKMDLSFRPLEGTRLATVDLGRLYLESSFTSELYVADQKVYVYSPFSFKETLLQDTLYLISSGQLSQKQLFPYPEIGNDFPAYSIPLRLGKRYLLASYQANEAESENYLFCFDRKTNKAFSLNGFNDDFFKTGIVKDLQPLDPYNQEYYFFKSGKEVSLSFPEREENANPILFFVRLNG
jgi:hypothetical protein